MKLLGFTKRVAAGALALGLLAGCDLLAQKIQAQVDAIWNTPAKKASFEADAEAKLKTQLDAELDGKEFEVPGPNPYIHHIKSVNVDLGTTAPTIAVPGTVNVTQTATSYYLDFDVQLAWAKGNGARLDVACDMRSHHWYLFGGYPDHTLHVHDITATAAGHAIAIVPKAGGQATTSITINSADVDLKAGAEGWFWTIDVSNTIKAQVKDQVVRNLIGKTLDYTFSLPAGSVP